MINFLGSIQKIPDKYNLKDNPGKIKFKKLGNRIGFGASGKIYAFPLKQNQTKKEGKLLAYKETYKGFSYNIRQSYHFNNNKSSFKIQQKNVRHTFLHF